MVPCEKDLLKEKIISIIRSAMPTLKMFLVNISNDGYSIVPFAAKLNKLAKTLGSPSPHTGCGTPGV